MNRNIFSPLALSRGWIKIAFAFFCFASIAFAQNSAPGVATPPDVSAQGSDPKAEAIIKNAITALGGEAFLRIQSVTGRGLFTPYQGGGSTIPVTFVDYLVFPDRERTEFRSGRRIQTIQTNTGNTGWVYDGAARTLRDLKPEQTQDFRITLRTGVDNILRGWWRAEGATLAYAGRREAGLARRNEIVRLTYTDGFTVEFEFGAKDYLPAKVSYKRRNDEGKETAEEDRFAKYVAVEGVPFPFVIDHYRDGAQTSRINYDSVAFNQPLPDSLFTRPADAKAIR